MDTTSEIIGIIYGSINTSFAICFAICFVLISLFLHDIMRLAMKLNSEKPFESDKTIKERIEAYNHKLLKHMMSYTPIALIAVVYGTYNEYIQIPELPTARSAFIFLFKEACLNDVVHMITNFGSIHNNFVVANASYTLAIQISQYIASFGFSESFANFAVNLLGPTTHSITMLFELLRFEYEKTYHGNLFMFIINMVSGGISVYTFHLIKILLMIEAWSAISPLAGTYKLKIYMERYHPECIFTLLLLSIIGYIIDIITRVITCFIIALLIPCIIGPILAPLIDRYYNELPFTFKLLDFIIPKHNIRNFTFVEFHLKKYAISIIIQYTVLIILPIVYRNYCSYYDKYWLVIRDVHRKHDNILHPSLYSKSYEFTKTKIVKLYKRIKRNNDVVRVDPPVVAGREYIHRFPGDYLEVKAGYNFWGRIWYTCLIICVLFNFLPMIFDMSFITTVFPMVNPELLKQFHTRYFWCISDYTTLPSTVFTQRM